jgi:hypothetical protein
MPTANCQLPTANCQLPFGQVIKNDFVLLLLLVFLTNTALMAFGFALSAFIQK